MKNNTSANEYILKMENITQIYDNGFVANKDVNFAIKRGEIHGLVGENGAGKTTLMKILFGQEKPERGRILLDGEEVHIESPLKALDYGIGMVHQHFMLVGSLTVAENMVLGMEPKKGALFNYKDALQKTNEIAERFKLPVNAEAKVNDISVGQKCTVWGNLTVDKTTANTLGICEALNVDIPVYSGCNRPMVKDRSKYRDLGNSYEPVFKDGKELKIHYDRLEGLPETDKKAEEKNAVEFYYDYLKNTTEPVTIIAVGPLTNLGFLFRLDPSLAKKVDQLIIMGGGVNITNCSIAGEANIWHDPEAFQIILDTGIHPLLVPLDATHAAALNLEDCAKLESLNTFEANFAAQLVRQRIEFESTLFGPERMWSPIHDALAVCACIDKSVLVDVQELACKAGLSGSADGEVLIDRRAVPDKANASIALSADKDKFMSMLYKFLA